MIPDISEAQWLRTPPRAPPRAFGTDWQGADWEFWEGIRPWSRVGEEWRDVERLSVLATTWGIKKNAAKDKLKVVWGLGCPLHPWHHVCEISKMQVWMNIMFYYSILLERKVSGVRNVRFPSRALLVPTNLQARSRPAVPSKPLVDRKRMTLLQTKPNPSSALPAS